MNVQRFALLQRPARLLRLAAMLVVAATAAIGVQAQAATSCGPSGREGVERCVSGLAAATLSQMQQQQEASNWCWAASISMLLRRYGIDVPQEQVVRTHLGKRDNVQIEVRAIPVLVDRRWDDADGRSVVASVSPLPSWRMRLGVTAPEVLDELAQERPVIVAAQKHAFLLVQVVYDRVKDSSGTTSIELVRAVVLDPGTTSGVRSLRSNERNPDLLALVRAEPVNGSGLAVASAAAR